MAAKVQVADLEKKGIKTLYVSKDGTSFQPNPIYNDIAANFLIDYSVVGSDKKVVYLSKDGTSFQPNPIYNDLAKNFFIGLAAPTPTITKPPDIHVKEGGWGGNQDPFTWSIVSMQDEPNMFKIVDDKNVNIAHRFETQQKAQQFIDYYKSITPGTTPVTTTGPTPGEIIEDGVKMFYPEVGTVETFTYKSDTEGRAQWVANLSKPLINMEVTGYLKIKGVDNDDEEVSIKTRGGRHSDKKDEYKPLGCCYISGVKYNGKVNSQYECPHPTNHAMSLHEKAGNFNPGSIIGKWFGIKNIVYYDGSKDIIKVYLDMDANQSTGAPSNNWKLFFETTSTEFAGKENSKGEPKVFYRLDDISGDPEENVELKFATVREINPNQ
jgi:hypothetical protein